MKHLLYKIALFLIPIVLVWLAVEVFYRSAPNNYTFKYKQLEAQKASVETLIFGDSHAFFGINPEFLNTKSFNASNISQSLYFDELIFNKYLDEMPRLKTVVITIGYTSLSQQDNTSEDVWRKYFYTNQMDLEVPIVSNWDIKKYSLALTRRFKKSVELSQKYHAEGSVIGCDNSGWGYYYTVENSIKDIEANAVYIAKKHEDGLLDFTVNTKRIQKIIEESIAKGISIQLVFMPVSSAYAEQVNSNKVNAINNTLEALSKANKNTNYYNLFQDSRFNNSDFYDANHLNTKGAKKCSIILDELIN